MAIILLSGHQFSYTVVRKSISSLRLRLKTRHSFIVSASHFIPNFLIIKFINDHSGWILKNSLKLPIKSKTKLTSLQTLSILGVSYQVILRQSSRDSLVIFEETHQIHLNSSRLTSDHLKTVIDKKLRPLALSLINQELKELSSSFGFKYGHVSVRNTTSRFGSCSPSGNLNFNWQIILFPHHVFRHVLIHELCHTVHHNHSLKFWSLVSTCDPQYLSHRFWLKKEANHQMIFI